MDICKNSFKMTINPLRTASRLVKRNILSSIEPIRESVKKKVMLGVQHFQKVYDNSTHSAILCAKTIHEFVFHCDSMCSLSILWLLTRVVVSRSHSRTDMENTIMECSEFQPFHRLISSDASILRTR